METMNNGKRAKMPVSQRAKQFMPFDAVSGLRQALRKKEHEMGLISRKELSLETREDINETLSMIGRGDTVAVSYFEEESGASDREGEIIDAEGEVLSIDPAAGTITLTMEGRKDMHGLCVETVINIDDIVSIMV